MENYVQAYFNLINGVKLTTLFGLIGLDFILGVVIAILSKTFDWKKLADFLDTDVLKLAAGYFLVGFFALAEPSATAAVWATWAAIDAKLIADIVEKLKQLGVKRE